MSDKGIGAAVRRKEDYRFLTGRGTYTDDIAFTDPTFEIAAKGKEELRKLYADLGTDKTSYAEVVWRIETTVIQADRIVIRGNWSGRLQGCAFDVEFVTLWKLRDGLIAEQTDFFAAGTFDRQGGWDGEGGAATCAERS